MGAKVWLGKGVVPVLGGYKKGYEVRYCWIYFAVIVKIRTFAVAILRESRHISESVFRVVLV